MRARFAVHVMPKNALQVKRGRNMKEANGEEISPPKDLIPKRPWTTNGKSIYDAVGTEVLRFNPQSSIALIKVTYICEHICTAVNEYEEEHGNTKTSVESDRLRRGRCRQ